MKWTIEYKGSSLFELTNEDKFIFTPHPLAKIMEFIQHDICMELDNEKRIIGRLEQKVKDLEAYLAKLPPFSLQPYNTEYPNYPIQFTDSTTTEMKDELINLTKEPSE